MEATTPAPAGKMKQNNGEVEDVGPSSGVRRTEQYCGSVLNPKARVWGPKRDKAPVEDRCLFVTFSNGSPLSQRQIYDFFTREYGLCVERVYIQTQDNEDKPPLFGKVIFNKSAIAAAVMGGQSQVKFIVDEKPLWCKRFQNKNVIMSKKKYVI